MEISKKINPDLIKGEKEIENLNIISSRINADSNHPVEKEEPDEVIIPRKDDNDPEEIPNEVKIPRKDDSDTGEIPDEVVIPRNDDGDLNEIPDEVVIPRKEPDTETL